MNAIKRMWKSIWRSSEPERIVKVQPFTLHIVSDMAQTPHPGYEGYCQGREIWVMWSGRKDNYGKQLPNFYMLGHEIWHLLECGATWHGDGRTR